MNRNMKVTKECRICNKPQTLEVNYDGCVKWQEGAYIQNAMPYLNVDERELLISGTCRDCFDRMFGEED